MKYHPLLERQVRKHLPDELREHPALRDLLMAVHASYQHFEDNRLLVERAMRLGSEELFEKNKQLLNESEQQKLLIESLRKAIREVAPHYSISEEAGLLRIADLLNDAIAERKQVEAQLEEARQIAEESLRTRQVLLANISHEIRTPVHAISGMASLLLDTDLFSTQHTYAAAIRTSADGLLVIINDLLDMSRLESGRFRLESIPFRFHDLLGSLLQSVFLKADEKGIELKLIQEYPADGWHLGDPTRIRQVLLNLVSNAIKFTESGHVSILIRIEATSSGVDQVYMEVEDTGIGIDPENIPRVFEQFMQEDDSVSRKFGGTGLGLSISRTLVHMMGGTIGLRSEKGKGSCFSIKLSLPRTARPSEEKEEVKSYDFSGLRVLIVDDNELNRFLAMAILSRWNVETLTAADGIEALERLEVTTVDAVLLDIQMPRMDGFETLRRLRSAGLDHLPVIALSANASEEEKIRAMDSGMTDYLSKPFTPEQLGDCMSLHIRVSADDSATAHVELDLSRLEVMFAGNQEHIRRTTGIFSSQLASDAAQLASDLNNRNYEGIERTCHRLLPNLELFGAVSLANALRRVESLARERMQDELRDRLPGLVRELESLSVQLHKLMQV